MSRRRRTGWRVICDSIDQLDRVDARAGIFVIVSAAVIAAISFLAGCGGIMIGGPECPNGSCPRPDRDQPPIRSTISVNIPVELREANYARGSCVHASLETTLRHQGRYDLARWWRESYRGGEDAGGLEAKMERAGLRWASTTAGDPEFLEWVSRTRRSAVIFYKPNHAVTFVEFSRRLGKDTAKIIDNNHPGRYEHIEKKRFLRGWRGYGGFAATVVGTPPPPPLWRSRIEDDR